jgi:hypothetical protein
VAPSVDLVALDGRVSCRGLTPLSRPSEGTGWIIPVPILPRLPSSLPRGCLSSARPLLSIARFLPRRGCALTPTEEHAPRLGCGCSGPQSCSEARPSYRRTATVGRPRQHHRRSDAAAWALRPDRLSGRRRGVSARTRGRTAVRQAGGWLTLHAPSPRPRSACRLPRRAASCPRLFQTSLVRSRHTRRSRSQPALGSTTSWRVAGRGPAAAAAQVKVSAARTCLRRSPTTCVLSLQLRKHDARGTRGRWRSRTAIRDGSIRLANGARASARSIFQTWKA